MSKPHILLIHGAYHQAWHLRFLKAELEKVGYKATAIDLPAGGDNAPTTGGLAVDTKAIKDLMEAAAGESESLLPVFHSYGGIPGSEALAEVTPATAKKVQRVIYLSAFVIPAETGLTTPFGGNVSEWSTISDDGKFATVTAQNAIPVFYQDVEPELANEAATHIVRYSKSAFDDHTKHCGWKLFPKTYIFCSDDRTIPMVYSKSVFDAMPEDERAGWDFETIEGGHSPFLSRPEECARLIRKIVGEAVA